MNYTLTAIEKAFKEAMTRNLLAYDGDIIADGKIHRFHVAGDKSHCLNGWYVLYSDGIPSGAYGSWKTGVTYSWCFKSPDQLTAVEREQHQEKLHRLQSQRALIKAQEHEQASCRAYKIWGKGHPPSPSHPYLLKKRVQPYSLRQINDELLVPLTDTCGKLHNLQIITPAGNKYFLRGGRVHGMFCLLGEFPSAGQLYICEGWATAATIHELTRCNVVAAMNAGNIKPVAKNIHQHVNTDVSILIAADNDRNTPNNPGLSKGKEAALATNAGLIWPQFNCEQCHCSDFNDLHACDIEKGVSA